MPITLAGRTVGTGGPCFFIAEAGVNHDGSLDKAIELAEVARGAGADAVKFQSFDAGSLLRRDAAKPGYQVRTTGEGETQYQMLERLQLSEQEERAVADHCRAIGITFMSTPYDVAAVERLTALGVPAIKIASADIIHGPLLESAARTGLPVIVSTGAANLDEVRQAVDLLAGAGCDDVIVLQCTTSYPAPPADINLAAMAALATLGKPVGFSDHSTGTTLAIAARALGAAVIEKHFTLDPSGPGPDHAASLDPRQLAALIAAIREVEVGLGDGVKEVRDIERDTRALMRRSIVAGRSLTAGSVLTDDDLAYKRPGTGISPMEWREVVGRRLAIDVEPDHPIARDELTEPA
ncbi:MAG TPA: N-acetylneuraminate synthase family protein [Candidatus Limnocylindria bacterium]|nr:N-acetylneuraminate synthase family protein [Candidatus Limnocylindria bacterium]